MSRRLSATGLPAVASLLVLVSSACCVGPLAIVLSFVGLTGGTLLEIENAVGPFRPAMLTLTVVALAAGFRSSYRSGAGSCEEGQPCALPRNRRIERIFLWIAAALFLTLLYFTYVHPNLDVLFGIY